MLPRKILVTVANRGIGLSTPQALVIRSPSDHYRLATRSMARPASRQNGDRFESSTSDTRAPRHSPSMRPVSPSSKSPTAERLGRSRKLRSDLQTNIIDYWRRPYDDNLPVSHQGDSSRRSIDDTFSARASCRLSSIGSLRRCTQSPIATFYAVSPGHCKTAFNGFRGIRNPLEGWKIALELALAEDRR
ncbi:hypothetical protein BDR22DRAFT_886218 [Usnea florida]